MLVCNFLLGALWKRQNYRRFCIVVALKTQNLEQVNPFQNCEIVMCVNGNSKMWPCLMLSVQNCTGNLHPTLRLALTQQTECMHWLQVFSVKKYKKQNKT